MAIFLDEMLNVNTENDIFSSDLQKLSEEMNCTHLEQRFCRDDGGIEICYEAEVAFNELNMEMGGYEFKALQEAEGETAETKDQSVWEKIKDKVKGFFKKIWETILKIWNGIKGFFKHIMDYFTGKADEEMKQKIADAEAKATADEKARIVDILSKQLVYDPAKIEKPINTCKENFNKFFVATEAFINLPQDTKDQVFSKKHSDARKAEDALSDSIDRLNNLDISVRVPTSAAQIAKKAHSVAEIKGYSDKIDGYKKDFEDLAKKCDKTVARARKICDIGDKLAASAQNQPAIRNTRRQASSAARSTQMTARLMQSFFNKLKAIKENYKQAIKAAGRAVKNAGKVGI